MVKVRGYEVVEGLYYSKDFIWVQIEDKKARIGITDYARRQLREISFIKLPTLGSTVKQNETFATLKSVKMFSRLVAPLSGTLEQVNEDVQNNLGLLNEPYVKGWLLVMSTTNLNKELKELMDFEKAVGWHRKYAGMPRLVFLTQFFLLVGKRRFAEAERVLERLKLRVQRTERDRGYFQALNGILIAKKSNDDQYAFLSNVNPNNENELKSYRREFLKSSRNGLHADYDRGFFSAWADYMRILIKLRDTERKNAKMKTKQLARSKREKTVENKSTQPLSEVETRPKKMMQTKLG